MFDVNKFEVWQNSSYGSRSTIGKGLEPFCQRWWSYPSSSCICVSSWNVATLSSQSRLKMIASMQLNAILSYSRTEEEGLSVQNTELNRGTLLVAYNKNLRDWDATKIRLKLTHFSSYRCNFSWILVFL